MTRLGCLGWWDGPNFGDDLALRFLEQELHKRFGINEDYYHWGDPNLFFNPITQLRVKSDTPGTTTVTEAYEMIKSGVALSKMYDALIIGPGGLMPWVVNHTFPDNVWGDIPIYLVGLGWAPHLDVAEETMFKSQVRQFMKTRNVQWGWARDAVMKQLMEDAGVPSCLAPDIVFGCTPRWNDVRQDTVAICPNAMGNPVTDMERLSCWISLLENRHYTVKLLPSSGVRGQLDVLWCYELAAKHPNAEFIEWVPNHYEFANELLQCVCTYSMRKHPAIVAQLAGQGVWVLDVMGSFKWMQDVAGGYATLVGGLHDSGTEDEWHVYPDELQRAVPDNWSSTCETNRQRVATALDMLYDNLKGA